MICSIIVFILAIIHISTIGNATNQRECSNATAVCSSHENFCSHATEAAAADNNAVSTREREEVSTSTKGASSFCRCFSACMKNTSSDATGSPSVNVTMCQCVTRCELSLCLRRVLGRRGQRPAANTRKRSCGGVSYICLSSTKCAQIKSRPSNYPQSRAMMPVNAAEAAAADSDSSCHAVLVHSSSSLCHNCSDHNNCRSQDDWLGHSCHLTQVTGSSEWTLLTNSVFRPGFTSAEIEPVESHTPFVPTPQENTLPQTSSAATTATTAAKLQPLVTTAESALAQALESASYQLKNVTLIIDGDYDVLVGNKREEFERHILIQIAESLQISPDRIRNLSVQRGSIIVTFQLQLLVGQVDARSHVPLADPLQLLNQLVETEQLQLLDLHGNRLVIAGDTLCQFDVTCHADDDRGQQQLSTTQAWALFGTLSTLVAVLVTVAVAVAVAVRHKQRCRHKTSVTPLTASGQSNSYNQFQLDQMLEGTSASIEKYKSTASSVYTPSDIYFSDSLAFGESAFLQKQHLDQKEDVPGPASYGSPTIDQLVTSRVDNSSQQSSTSKLTVKLPPAQTP